MSVEVKALYRIRKLLEGLTQEAGGSNDVQAALTEQLELLIAPGATPYQEINRLGASFWTGGVAAVAAVVAIPTTACMFAIYNNEADGDRSLVIDFVAAQNVVSTAVASQAQLLVNIGQVRETAPTSAAMTIKAMNGMGSTDTRVRTILTATALPATTGLAANWLPWGPSAAKVGAAATPGYGLWVPGDGRIIVPPGRYFAMHVLANVVGETFMPFIGWHEKQITLA